MTRLADLEVGDRIQTSEPLRVKVPVKGHRWPDVVKVPVGTGGVVVSQSPHRALLRDESPWDGIVDVLLVGVPKTVTIGRLKQQTSPFDRVEQES